MTRIKRDGSSFFFSHFCFIIQLMRVTSCVLRYRLSLGSQREMFRNLKMDRVSRYLDEQEELQKLTINDQFKQHKFSEEAFIVLLTSLFAYPQRQKDLDPQKTMMFQWLSKSSMSSMISILEALSNVLRNTQFKDQNQEDVEFLFKAQTQLIKKSSPSLDEMFSYLSCFHDLLPMQKLKWKSYANETEIDELFKSVEGKILPLLVNNIDMFISIKDIDPLKIAVANSQKSSKWKIDNDHASKYEINRDKVDCASLMKIVWLFYKLRQGSSLFYFCTLKYLELNIQSPGDIMELHYMLAYFDKLGIVDQSKYSGIINQNIDSLFASKKIFYRLLSFTENFQEIANLAEIHNKGTQVDGKLDIPKFVSNELIKFEYQQENLLETNQECLKSFIEFQQQLYCPTFLQEIERYLEKEKFLYQTNNNINVWNLPFVFEFDKVVMVPLSGGFYLGKTKQPVFWNQIYKRLLRNYGYKIRLVDIYEYGQLETRHRKDKYLQHKLKGLQQGVKPPRKPYFNFYNSIMNMLGLTFIPSSNHACSIWAWRADLSPGNLRTQSYRVCSSSLRVPRRRVGCPWSWRSVANLIARADPYKVEQLFSLISSSAQTLYTPMINKNYKVFWLQISALRHLH